MNRRRGLIVAGVAALVVAGMLWADAVTLQRADPSFHNEERNLSNLILHSAPPHPPASTTTTTTTPRR